MSATNEIIQILKCSPKEAAFIAKLMQSYTDMSKMKCSDFARVVKLLRSQKPELN
jgi:hypothetical protein